MVLSEYDKVEEQVSSQAGSYQGLQVEALLTCDDDFLSIFEALPEIQSWVELGSGHGKGPLLFGSLSPSHLAIGIEFEFARFEFSLRKQNESKLTNVHFIHADLLTCSLPDSDAYFLYFPTGIVLDRILHELGKKTGSFKIIAIESHGDLLPRLEREVWLKADQKVALKSNRHHPFAVIFEKCGTKETSLHDLSFQNKYLLIEDLSGESWLGESYGLEWLRQDDFQLLIPPRTISHVQVKKVLEWDEIQVRYHSALRLRKLGSLTICTSSGIKAGYLRKIFVSPSFKLEISSGEQVEWSEVKQIFWENTLCFDSSSDYFFYPHVV